MAVKTLLMERRRSKKKVLKNCQNLSSTKKKYELAKNASENTNFYPKYIKIHTIKDGDFFFVPNFVSQQL